MLDSTAYHTITEQTFDKLKAKALDLISQESETKEYFIAETGAGKSKAIVKFVTRYGHDHRIAIVLNSKSDVIAKAEELDSINGLNIQSWLSERNTPFEKSNLKYVQVAIVTHQFFSYPSNRNFLGERDIFIVDEMPIWEKHSNFTVYDMQKAFDKLSVERQDLEPIRKSMTWLNEEKPSEKYLPLSEVKYPALFEGLRQLADMGDAKSEEVIEAIRDGRAILYTDTYINPRNSPVSILYPLKNPLRNDKALVVSATAHLEGGQLNANPAKPEIKGNYRNLQICKLKWPDITTEIRNATIQEQDMMFDIIDQILRHEARGETLIVTYKRWEERFKGKLNKLEFSRRGEAYGNKVHITHHGTDIGANTYKDCKEVIFIGLNNIPEYVDLAEVFYHSEGQVTEATLQEVKRKGGKLEQLRIGKRSAELKQMIARGCCRHLSTDGVAGQMRAWLIVPSQQMQQINLNKLFPNHQAIPQPKSIEYEKREPTSIQSRIMLILEETDSAMIAGPEMDKIYKERYGVKSPVVNKNANKLPLWLEGSGWRFVRGNKGRGAESSFHKIK